jgi:hypothetical protein
LQSQWLANEKKEDEKERIKRKYVKKQGTEEAER